MQQAELLISRLEEMAACYRQELSLGERAGLFSGAETAGRLIHEFITEHAHDDGYAHEKTTQAIWHLGAMVGFDVDNGHDSRQHAGWALASLSSLSDVLRRHLKP